MEMSTKMIEESMECHAVYVIQKMTSFKWVVLLCMENELEMPLNAVNGL
jgi:hypothetical protein